MLRVFLYQLAQKLPYVHPKVIDSISNCDFSDVSSYLDCFVLILPIARQDEFRIDRDVEDEEVIVLLIHEAEVVNFGNYMMSTNGGAFIGAVDLLSTAVMGKIGDNAPGTGIEVLKRRRNGA